MPAQIHTATTHGYVDFEGAHTWYRIEGAHWNSPRGKAPLVVVHGGPGSTHDYLAPLGDLARSQRAVIFYDQLGCGRSTHLPERPPSFWTLDLFVAELANLIAKLRIGDRYHLLGHSWGGFLAQEHAFGEPTGMRSLLLSNTADSYRDLVAEERRLRSQLPAAVRRQLEKHETAGTTDDPEYAAACMVFYVRHLCRVTPWPAQFARSFRESRENPSVFVAVNGPSEFYVTGTAADWAAGPRLASILTPTLVLSGRHDGASPYLAERLADAIPSASRHLFDASSHSPFWEERARYIDVLDAWLEQWD